tara:strand:- start:428599 stop:429723 length:1125 start_codon:yes stop_codon:yes gene_type:complete
MSEDLKHIDLIDKYLNKKLKGSEVLIFQELIEKDDAFKKEVEILEKVYEKIELRGERNLKKRLDVYYKEYLEEVEKQAKPKGLYRQLMIVSGIAAAIIVGVIIYNSFDTNGSNEIFKQHDPIIVDIEEKDSLKTNDLPKQNDVIVQENITKDTLSNKDEIHYDNTQLAIGGLQKLPKEFVRSINYPIALQYTFNGTKLELFGDPSIPSLQLQLLKDNNNVYFLSYEGHFYSLTKTASNIPLTTTAKQLEVGEPTQEKITVELQGIEAVSSLENNLEVSFTGEQLIEKTYLFEEKEGKLQLIINGTIDLKKTNVYAVRDNSKTAYYLLIDKKLYLLNSKTTTPKSLKETYILTNKQTQLFRENRILPPKTVYLIK